MSERPECPACAYARMLGRTCARPAGEPPAHLPGCAGWVSGGVGEGG